MSISTQHDIDVLIVGAGPAGTMLALELALQNVSFRIVDKAPRRSEKSRALIVQPRSFEVLARHGEAHRLYQKGSPTSGPLMWMNRKPVIDIDVGLVADYCGSEFALPCLLSQVDTEAYLAQCLKERYGREVEYGIVATSIVQDAKGVDVTLRSVSKEFQEQIRAQYVVGADGAHSIVRKSSKHIKFEGATYPQNFFLCDAIMENLTLPKNRYHIVLETGLFAIFPMAEGWVRIMGSHTNSSQAVPTIDEVNDLIREKLPRGGTVVEVTWIANFQLHHYVANSYRDGRLFLVGDAAHIHSPVGGQGLNTALQDSLNLGWKLARVLRRERPESFLDTFDAERRRVGRKLVANTDEAFKLISMTNPLAVSLRNWIIPWVASYITSVTHLRKVYNFLSQFGINYRDSPIAHKNTEFKGPVMPGDRAPDGDINVGSEDKRLYGILAPEAYNMVLFSGSLPQRTRPDPEMLDRAINLFKQGNIDTARIHVISYESGGGSTFNLCLHETYGLSEGGFVYIRPDGYVSAIGNLGHLDEFIAWLNKSNERHIYSVLAKC